MIFSKFFKGQMIGELLTNFEFYKICFCDSFEFLKPFIWVWLKVVHLFESMFLTYLSPQTRTFWYLKTLFELLWVPFLVSFVYFSLFRVP